MKGWSSSSPPFPPHNPDPDYTPGTIKVWEHPNTRRSILSVMFFSSAQPKPRLRIEGAFNRFKHDLPPLGE